MLFLLLITKINGALTMYQAGIKACYRSSPIWSLQPPHETGTIIIDILQKKKLKPRDVKELAYYHTAGKRQRGDLNPVGQALEPVLSFRVYCSPSYRAMRAGAMGGQGR